MRSLCKYSSLLLWSGCGENVWQSSAHWCLVLPPSAHQYPKQRPSQTLRGLGLPLGTVITLWEGQLAAETKRDAAPHHPPSICVFRWALTQMHLLCLLLELSHHQ